jgi:hypothetical protein
VIDLAEPPLQAETMISSSITASLILRRQQLDPASQSAVDLLGAAALYDEDIFVAHRGVYTPSAPQRGESWGDGRMCTEVSPLANLLSWAVPRFMPRRSQMPSTSTGWEEPLKTIAPRMLGGPSSEMLS